MQTVAASSALPPLRPRTLELLADLKKDLAVARRPVLPLLRGPGASQTGSHPMVHVAFICLLVCSYPENI